MSFLFGRPRVSPQRQAAERLHDGLVAQIRQPVFYTAFKVADTFEGRFDLLVLHTAVVLRRLQALGPAGQDLAQHLVDLMFSRFDIALRELGVSDVAVPKRMKRIAEAFKGRTTAYEEGLSAPDSIALTAAVTRNVLAGVADGADLTRYILAAHAQIDAVSLATLERGSLPFLDPAAFLDHVA